MSYPTALDTLIEALMDLRGEPQLGYATTRQLLEEIAARGRMEQHYQVLGSDMAMGADNLLDVLPGSMLDYRTVDS